MELASSVVYTELKSANFFRYLGELKRNLGHATEFAAQTVSQRFRFRGLGEVDSVRAQDPTYPRPAKIDFT